MSQNQAGAKRRHKRRWIIPLIILLLAGGFFFLRGIAARGPLAYTTVPVTRGDLEVLFSFTGNIHAPNSETMQAASSATVRDVYVEANQEVRKGDRILRLDDGTIWKAQLDGEVTVLDVQPGDYVSQGRTMAVITDLHRMEVEIQVDEYDVGAITLGKEVSVYAVAADETSRGTIVAFNKQGTHGSQLTSYTATVAVEEMEHALPGMQVEVTLVKDRAERVLLLPKEAVRFTESNTPYVYLSSSDGSLLTQSITTGITDGVNVEITGGLMEGSNVVVQQTGSSGAFLYGQGADRFGQGRFR
ncbi:MAG: efflux RND transporter periplasmic adaptor subunit [Clostridia bacterium]|nr:efflux RND transporter periplasmic adaptor subunit [Clostridia bacterium]